jgi:GalNAc-alpha-(1->4)-GalNAc-alpha-(1->3)-diNAcBac-PP-undecaprenol alpha-1,4-N-acetyl-D-galactosaminyltransferase
VKIALFIGTLNAGGAERVLSVLANNWAELGHDVQLVTFSDPTDDHYPVVGTVERRSIGTLEDPKQLLRRTVGNLRRLGRLRALLRDGQPDVVISFIDKMNLLALVASFGLGLRVVISERTDPRRHKIGRVAGLLRRALYPMAEAVVVQTDSVASWVGGFVDPQKIRVIPNPAPRSANGTRIDSFGVPRPFVVALGRLVPLKGFDILIAAFAACAERHSDWALAIIGDGPERNRLESMAAGYGIAERVHLLGLLRDPNAALQAGSIFALTSEYEGFPNALLEAMAAGLAPVSFDCPSGPRAIIRHGIDGILVPPNDRREFALALDSLMADEERRAELATRAREVTDRFSVGNVLQEWADLLAMPASA